MANRVISDGEPRSVGDGRSGDLKSMSETVAPLPDEVRRSSVTHGLHHVISTIESLPTRLDAERTLPFGYYDFADNARKQSLGSIPRQRLLTVGHELVRSAFSSTNIAGFSESSEQRSSLNVLGLPPIRNAPSTASLRPIDMGEARKRHQMRLTSNKDGWWHSLGDEDLTQIFPGRNFPFSRVTVFVGTWNVAGKLTPDAILQEWLLQEAVQQCLISKQSVYKKDPYQKSKQWGDWEITLPRCLGSSHVLFPSVWLGVQHLAIFVRSSNAKNERALNPELRLLYSLSR